MKRNLLLIIESIILIITCVFGLAACGNSCDHIFSIKYDDTYHWYECDKCSDIEHKEEHDTSYANGKCSVCHYGKNSTENPPVQHNHVWAETLSYDETHHWYACTVADCAEKNGYAAHDFENGDCICGQADNNVGLKYTLNADRSGYMVKSIGTLTEETDIVIASYYDGKAVTGICDNAFSGCTNITNVTIPNSVTSIGDNSFAGCSGITNITIPDSVTHFGENAFDGCLIETATVPAAAISSIKNSKLKSLVITSGDNIADNALSDCVNLTNVTIANGVTKIGEKAFSGCSGITSIVIPDSVTVIGNDAFSGCPLEEATIPTVAISKIDKNNLKTVVIKGGDSIDNRAFYGCRSITSLTIENGIASIGSEAFSYCNGLTSISIPDSVTSIGVSAFNQCTNLASVTNADGVTSVGLAAFKFTPWYNAQPDGIVYIGKALYEYKGKMTEITSITIKEGTKSISGSAFSGSTYGNGLPYNLVSVTIPNSVTSIGNNAFSSCCSLANITIPDSVTYIGSNAFYDTAWYDNQPDGVVYAGKVAYAYKGTMDENTSVTIKEGTVSITDYTFKECVGLTNVTIPDSIKSIGKEAFYGCSGLTSIMIPESVIDIGSSALYGCTNLTSITFNGTKSQWNNITDGGRYYWCADNYTVHCADGDLNIKR